MAVPNRRADAQPPQAGRCGVPSTFGGTRNWAKFGVLSGRERQVLQLLSEGHTGPEAAAKLFLSPHTVRGHLERIYQRLGVRTAAHAVAEAMRRGLIA